MAPSFHFREQLLGEEWGLARGFLVEEFDNLYATLQAAESTVLSVAGQPGPSNFNSVSYVASNFFSQSGQTWTVQAADVATFGYTTVVGKMMTVFVHLINTSVAGTPYPVLFIIIPGGFVAKRTVASPFYMIDNGIGVGAVAFTAASQNLIGIVRNDQLPLAASVNNTQVSGQITFEVQ